MNAFYLNEKSRLDRRLWISATLTCAFLASLTATIYLTARYVVYQLPALTHMDELHDALVVLTKTLPIEIEIAALTQDAQRAEAYRRNAAHFAELTADLERAAHEPLWARGAFESVLELSAAHPVESAAAALVRAGRHAEAAKALRDANYLLEGAEKQRRVSAALIQCRQNIAATRSALRTRVFVLTGISAALGLLTIPAWAFTARATRRLQGRLATEYDVLSRGSEQLRVSLEKLDAQVAERTRMLKESESALLNMMEDAVLSRDRAEQALQELKSEVAERIRLEEQFRQAQKMEAIGRLSGGIAHDFNNLLTVILGHARVLEFQDLSEDGAEAVEEIKRAGERAAALTRQLLLFARKQPLQMNRIDLNEAVRGVTRMLERILGEDIALVFSPWGRPLAVDADEGMLDQVLINLAVNARDAMPSGGQLLIETSEAEFSDVEHSYIQRVKSGRFVCVAVSDTGCGIPRETLPKIFDPFFTTKDVGKGTGLGLATVFGIVEQHGGWIHAYSEEGRGSIFRVYLPARHEVSRDRVVNADRPATPGGTETLLLVEDEDSIRKMLVRYLERLGYTALSAANAASALEIFHERKADIRLLMTDIVMPGGMSGVELAAIAQREKADLAIIFTSGYSEMSAAGNTQLKEGVNFLAKPYDLPQVAEILRKHLDESPKE